MTQILPGTAMETVRRKTVTVSFQLRVPKQMMEHEIREWVKSRTMEAAKEAESISLYKGRVEVFMP